MGDAESNAGPKALVKALVKVGGRESTIDSISTPHFDYYETKLCIRGEHVTRVKRTYTWLNQPG